MKRIKVILFFFFSSLVAENSAPIFLLHGFLGWGRDEMEDFYYWGGKFDLETYLSHSGPDNGYVYASSPLNLTVPKLFT